MYARTYMCTHFVNFAVIFVTRDERRRVIVGCYRCFITALCLTWLIARDADTMGKRRCRIATVIKTTRRAEFCCSFQDPTTIRQSAIGLTQSRATHLDFIIKRPRWNNIIGRSAVTERANKTITPGTVAAVLIVRWNSYVSTRYTLPRCFNTQPFSVSTVHCRWHSFFSIFSFLFFLLFLSSLTL